VPHGDDVIRAAEDHDLPDVDLLARVVVERGLQDQEEHVAVVLELRALVGRERVLDRELVQVELGTDRLELLRRRLEEPDPHERAGLLPRLAGVVQRQRPGPAPPLLVDRALDDHATYEITFAPTRASTTTPSTTR
jgi:hypothetical protein